jgi:prolipoprotein diacylglyceryltransferase
VGCIVGAAIGNKLVFWIEMPHLLPVFWNKAEMWFAGQSMVGGLLGGLIGVELAKKLYGVRSSTGDAFVFPILLGLMIGRTGCFIAGLDDGTFGMPTDMPWGIDFGDGIPRHPTQLYEIVFAGVLWFLLHRTRVRWSVQPGLMFKVMLCSYLLWRLLVDALKPVPFDYGFGLSGIQIVCIVALLFYAPLSFLQWQKLKVA